ncbi:MAG: hypothetical protein ACRD0U_00235 [Acidimicrobiales bacterium]
MAGPRDEVSEALGRAASVAGVEVLRQPRRLRAVLSDLVGRPGSDHRTEIDAIVAAAEVLAGGDQPDEQRVVAALLRRDIDADAARWAVSALQAVGVEIGAGEVEGPGAAPPRWRRGLPLAAAAVAVIAVLGFIASRDGDDDNGSPVTTTTEPVTTTTAPPDPTAPPEPAGFLVDFEDAVEGAFQVSRTWEIREGRLTGTVLLTAIAGGDTTQHRELVPAEAFVEPSFSPEASTRIGDVAVFNVGEQSAGTFTIAFEADLTVAEPDEATVREWVDRWRERVVGLRPLDAEPAASATIAALD